MKLNVIGYIRVSTQGQARDGYSLKYQEEDIIAYCDENNLNLINVFRDEGISGAKLNEEWCYGFTRGLKEVINYEK